MTTTSSNASTTSSSGEPSCLPNKNHNTFTQSQLNNNFHNNNHLNHQPHNYHDQYNNNNHTTVQISSVTNTHQNNNNNSSSPPSQSTNNGTIVLDRLLASLTISEDEKHSNMASKINNQNSLPLTSRTHLLEANNNYIEPKSPIERFHDIQIAKMMGRATSQTPDLSNVIADLTDFDNSETMRRESSNSPKILNGGGVLKRLTSESDNCSSVSPSLSDKSNGVSWSDQVELMLLKQVFI